MMTQRKNENQLLREVNSVTLSWRLLSFCMIKSLNQPINVSEWELLVSL